MASARVISFARGVPSPDLLPVSQIAAAAQRALAEDPAGTLAYGDGAGYAPLREWVAGRYGGEAGRVLLSNGSLQGLAFLAETLFAGSGGRAIVEAPTYDRAILILRRFGATVETVDLQPDGLDVDAIEAMCAAGRTPGLVYTISNFQNPGGATLSLAKRERHVAHAREHGVHVLEDDPYGELRFSGADLPSMFSLEGGEQVIYSTSFTKTVAPGVRSGAMILPAPLHARLRKLAIDTYIGPSMLAESTVYRYCAAGEFEPGVERMRAALRERCDALTAALDRHLGDRVRYVRPEGGYFLWIELPGVDADALADRADAAGVPVVKGSSCYPDGRGREAIRLAFSACPAADMEEGIGRFARLV
jgi:DNA-binding transcriptional MocR family regulator